MPTVAHRATRFRNPAPAGCLMDMLAIEARTQLRGSGWAWLANRAG
ncbi:hypothetical protein [Nitrosovibrio tenuis]|uniref:Uncharacterized protein n=1 Tax=Nitrosovibrio tenuis TaxID=1233 RepID=A0A1H7ID07_9PROT|nr:hypothetical protein [Nitrosovibrio tenuis]SEK60224.1 hypothetical protein SAMN05216387_102129 [Nitrosovibrio tenuis]